MATPSFFKVIRDPSSPHLKLPSAFVRRNLEKIPENPILKTLTGEHSWRLKIEKIDGDYCFALGWNKLVQDFNLCLGDFLVFGLIDSSTFEVLIFHKDGCEKDPNLSNRNTSNDDDDGIRDENPCFQRAISEKTHKYTMRLPREFVEAAGIGNKSVVTIKDLEGREWLVGLLAETYPYQNITYVLSSGWSIFREYNELSDGDICLFKFIKNKGILTLVQVIKNKNTKKQESGERKTSGMKRKRGRPPLQKPRGGGDDRNGGCGFVEVRVEDESTPEVDGARRNGGRSLLESYNSSNRVIYF